MSDENTWTGPVVDAHAHFWDPIANDHPWLRPDVMKRPPDREWD